jgi:rhodanese-related sulfurtransferase
MRSVQPLAWFLSLAIVLIALPAPAAELTTIDGPQLEAMQADGKPIVIVDVREPELFAKGHIKGAINIPYDDARPRIVKELSPTDRIVFVCHGGPMGDKLGKLLAGKGYPEVYNLKGGMKKWKGPVFPSATLSPPS